MRSCTGAEKRRNSSTWPPLHLHICRERQRFRLMLVLDALEHVGTHAADGAYIVIGELACVDLYFFFSEGAN